MDRGEDQPPTGCYFEFGNRTKRPESSQVRPSRRDQWVLCEGSLWYGTTRCEDEERNTPSVNTPVSVRVVPVEVPLFSIE